MRASSLHPPMATDHLSRGLLIMAWFEMQMPPRLSVQAITVAQLIIAVCRCKRCTDSGCICPVLKLS